MKRRNFLRGMAVLLATKFLPAEKKVEALPGQVEEESCTCSLTMVVTDNDVTVREENVTKVDLSQPQTIIMRWKMPDGSVQENAWTWNPSSPNWNPEET